MQTIRALAASLASGQVSASGLAEASIDLLRQDWAKGDMSFISFDMETTLSAAARSDKLRAGGYVPSLLAGLPVSLKDLFDIKGQVTQAGSRVLERAMSASRDALAVARLRQAGAVFVGRTNMTEFAFSALGLNPHFGTPRNPIDARWVAGGSSSGAATSVARGHVVAALGTDTGGSIRIPAAFCGVTGFKPTARRVPLDGTIPLASSFDSIGALANSVDCCVVVDALLSGERLSASPRPLEKLRLAVSSDYVGEDLDSEVAIAFTRTLELLREAGASVKFVPFPELNELPSINKQGGLTAAEAWAFHRTHVETKSALYDPRVLQRIRLGEHVSAGYYISVLSARQRMVRIAHERLSRFDAWLMPTVSMVPPLLEPLERDDALFFRTNARALRNPSTVNFLDGCAISLPCHLAGERPVGLSVCGLPMHDQDVLAVAGGIEALLIETRSNLKNKHKNT